MEHDSENIKINRGSIRHVGQILEGIIATFQKEDLHRSEFNSALAPLQQSLHSIRQNIMKYQKIIECAFQHRLSIEALSHEGATEAYNSIKNKAKEKGLKTVISTARHLYKLHLDFKIKSFGLRLFITVNLYREKFKLHRYLFYPFKIPNQQITTSIQKMAKEFIAIGKIENELVFVEMTRDQVDKCKEINNVKICKHQSVIKQEHH